MVIGDISMSCFMIGTKYLRGGLTKAKFLLLTMCPFKDGSMQENVYVVYMLRIFPFQKL